MKKLLLVVFIFVLTSITLVACSDKVKVTFDSAGGSAVQSQTLEKGATVEKPDDPAKDGYVFEGWYFENKKWNFDEMKIGEDITLYARWTPLIIRNIKYELNGGVNHPENPLTYDNGKTVILEIREG